MWQWWYLILYFYKKISYILIDFTLRRIYDLHHISLDNSENRSLVDLVISMTCPLLQFSIKSLDIYFRIFFIGLNFFYIKDINIRSNFSFSSSFSFSIIVFFLSFSPSLLKDLYNKILNQQLSMTTSSSNLLSIKSRISKLPSDYPLWTK